MRTTFYTIVCLLLSLFYMNRASAQSACPPITPFCQDLNTSFMPEACMVEVWAKDFISKINNPETDIEDFIISFDKDELIMSLIFFSEDGDTRVISIWITNQCGEQTRCDVTLHIQDNTGECPVGCIDSEYTGFAVTTCTAPFGSNGTVGHIYDVRNNQSDAPKGCDWDDLPEKAPSNWKIDSIGPLFGIAMDEFDNIFVASSDVYKSNYTPVNGLSRAQIFKCEPPSFRAVPFVALPTSQTELNGIGNLAYNEKNNLLYASNLEDGKIYRIDLDRNILDTFDPFAADDGSSGIVDQDEQIWGIQINQEGDDCKLYFARITSGGARTMYSITLFIDGSFPAPNTVKAEITNLPGSRPRITDIAFSKNGTLMLTAERGTNFIPGQNQRGPHEAQVNRYTLNGTSWNAQQQIFVGERLNPTFNAGENSAGGIDFGYKQEGSNPLAQCDSLIWATGNLMRLPKVVPGSGGLPFILYGMEGINTSGNVQWAAGDTTSNVYCDLFKDFDGDYTDPAQDLGLDLEDKARIGDVEIFRCSDLGSTTQNFSNMATIAGAIISSSGEMMDNIEVQLNDKIRFTDNGYYSFTDVALNENYKIIPYKNDDVLAGVTTVDLIRIQRHILGIDQFKKMSSYLAADINNSGTVSSLDLIGLRKVLLGHQDNFSENTSWVFYDMHQSETVHDPFEIRHEIGIGQLESDAMENDFVAVKVGDIDESYFKTSQGRSISSVLADVHYAEGLNSNVAEITISQTNFDALGLDLDIMMHAGSSIQSIQIDGNELTENNFSFIDQKLKIIYDSEFQVGGLNISIEYSSKSISQKFLAIDGVVFDESYSARNIKISNNEIEQLLVSPNPLSEMFQINLNLRDDDNVQLELYSLSGSLIYSETMSGYKGDNEYRLRSDQVGLNHSGLYILKIGTSTHTHVSKIFRE